MNDKMNQKMEMLDAQQPLVFTFVRRVRDTTINWKCYRIEF